MQMEQRSIEVFSVFVDHVNVYTNPFPSSHNLLKILGFGQWGWKM